RVEVSYAIYRERVDGVVDPRAQCRPVRPVPLGDEVRAHTARPIEAAACVQVRAHDEEGIHREEESARDPPAQRRPVRAVPLGNVIDGYASGPQEFPARVQVSGAVDGQRKHLAIRPRAERRPADSAPLRDVVRADTPYARETAPR